MAAGADTATGRAERRARRAGRRRLRPARVLRLGHRHAGHRRPGRRGRAAGQLPHDRAVLADPGLPADRPQPPPQRDGPGGRPGRRLPRLPGTAAEGERLPVGDPARPAATPRWPSGSGTSPPRTRRTWPRPGRRGRSGGASTAGTGSTAARPTSSSRRSTTTTTRCGRPGRSEEGYHLSEDLADRAIEFVGDLRAVDADRPFFLYLATGACHSPHQAPAEWIDRYRGRFDGGWDAWREATHARQLALGVMPTGTRLSPRPPWVPAWDDLGDRDPGGGRPVHGVLRRLPLARRRPDRPGARLPRRRWASSTTPS